MPGFLVEVSQQADALTYKWIDESVRTLGSHFATHADWRRKLGVCTGTMVVEAADKWGAFGIVPPSMRSDAHVFRLRRKSFSGAVPAEARARNDMPATPAKMWAAVQVGKA